MEKHLGSPAALAAEQGLDQGPAAAWPLQQQQEQQGSAVLLEAHVGSGAAAAAAAAAAGGSGSCFVSARQADVCSRAALARRLYEGLLPRLTGEGLLVPLQQVRCHAIGIVFVHMW